MELVLKAGHISTSCGAVPVSTRQFSLFLDTALATFLHLMIVPRSVVLLGQENQSNKRKGLINVLRIIQSFYLSMRLRVSDEKRKYFVM